MLVYSVEVPEVRRPGNDDLLGVSLQELGGIV